MVTAAVFGWLGLLVVAIFGPLLFPLSLTDSSRAENMVLVLALMFFLLFGVIGIILCWRLTARWVRN